MSAIFDRESGARMQADFESDRLIVTLTVPGQPPLQADFPDFNGEHFLRDLLRQRRRSLKDYEHCQGNPISIVDTDNGIQITMLAGEVAIATAHLEEKHRDELIMLLERS